ncbi:MAG: DUF5050 domain-containing protein [Candidatus Bipolaricaulota bacterium]|nr:DUF5050 domain-containing protein [Candidatus Bipolaricaulota bacterium]
MARHKQLSAIIVGLLALAGIGSMGVTPTSTEDAVIAFVSKRNGNREIYLMDEHGGNQRRLTETRGDEDTPSWSPNGERLAFMYRERGSWNWDILTMSLDGSARLTLVGSPSGDWECAWAPAGGVVAFSSDRGGDSEIYVIHIQGGSIEQLTDNEAAIDGLPTWSPDGSSMAFFTDRDGNWEIYRMNADGSNPVRLTENASARDFAPAWSPDGSRIAFASDRDGNEEIYVMNADGSGLLRLTDEPRADTTPQWSPDGSKIVFSSARTGNGDIYVMDADGTDAVRLTDDPSEDTSPSWRPN